MEKDYLDIYLKPWDEVLRSATALHQPSPHYFKIMNQCSGGIDVCAVRDYYKSYFGTEVRIVPKFDRKGNQIKRIYWVVGKNGQPVFPAHRSWFIRPDDIEPFVNQIYRFKLPEVDPILSELSWDQLFDL